MADDVREMTQDGIFKMLTWASDALTQMFGYPAIDGDPVQQEFHEPSERRVDRLFPLADGPYLNVEHQTSLRDAKRLAERMVKYRLRARAVLPRDSMLRQVVIYTGAEPKDRSKVMERLRYDDRVPEDPSGLRFEAPVKDLLTVPIATFLASGKLDDMLLGLLGPGRADPAFRESVAARIRTMSGEDQRDAKVKFVAICATIGFTVDHLIGDLPMWIEDVKDTPVVREIVRIAGRDQMEGERRLGMAKVVAGVASARGIDVPDGFADELALYADEEQLMALTSRIDDLKDDVLEFVREHGVEIPTYGG